MWDFLTRNTISVGTEGNWGTASRHILILALSLKPERVPHLLLDTGGAGDDLSPVGATEPAPCPAEDVG